MKYFVIVTGILRYFQSGAQRKQFHSAVVVPLTVLPCLRLLLSSGINSSEI